MHLFFLIGLGVIAFIPRERQTGIDRRMLEVPMASFSATVFEPGSLEITDQGTDFSRHSLQYHFSTTSIGKQGVRRRLTANPSDLIMPYQKHK